MLTLSAHESDRTGFRRFLKITWEPFEMNFRPIETRFMHHVLVIVRTANATQTLQEYEYRTQKNLQEEGNNIIISSYWA